MQTIIKLTVALVLMMNVAQAQTTNNYKTQIYVGYNKVKGGNDFVDAQNFDINFVNKENWLFNTGLVFSSYNNYNFEPGTSSYLKMSAPKTFVKEINLSAGRRFDLTKRWSIAMYAGLSYTHVKYPENLQPFGIKTNVSVYPGINFSMGGTQLLGQMKTMDSFGVHINGEINFFLCENLSLQMGVMLDQNKVHKMGGITFGGRVGIMKQKVTPKTMWR